MTARTILARVSHGLGSFLVLVGDALAETIDPDPGAVDLPNLPGNYLADEIEREQAND